MVWRAAVRGDGPVTVKTRSKKQRQDMKKASFVIFTGFVLGGFLLSEGRAQVAPPAAVPQPAAAATNRPPARTYVDALAQRLKLSDEQKEKAKAVFDEQNQKYTAMRTNMATLKPEERRAKYMAVREETNAKLKTIFTPEQWEQYSKPMQARPNMMRPGTNAPVSVPAVPATPAPATPAPATPAK
jgi:hypothetical protein